MEQLMDKLIKAKAIMNHSDKIKRGDVRDVNRETLREFDVPQARYNIPEDMIMHQNINENIPSLNRQSNSGPPTIEAIKNSKLPNEIKRLMIEHPIGQPQTAKISDEILEKASRLMGNTGKGPSVQKEQIVKEGDHQINYKVIQKMIDESIMNAFKKSGLISENEEKSNEVFSFRVGKHIFEGKITKVKKIN